VLQVAQHPSQHLQALVADAGAYCTMGGGGEAAEAADGEGGGGAGMINATSETAPRSWKDMVNAETRVPFEIMGSPLFRRTLAVFGFMVTA
jgi:hypothetical protein